MGEGGFSKIVLFVVILSFYSLSAFFISMSSDFFGSDTISVGDSGELSPETASTDFVTTFWQLAVFKVEGLPFIVNLFYSMLGVIEIGIILSYIPFVSG